MSLSESAPTETCGSTVGLLLQGARARRGDSVRGGQARAAVAQAQSTPPAIASFGPSARSSRPGLSLFESAPIETCGSTVGLLLAYLRLLTRRVHRPLDCCVQRDYIDGLGDSFDLVPIGAYQGRGKRAGTSAGPNRRLLPTAAAAWLTDSQGLLLACGRCAAAAGLAAAASLPLWSSAGTEAGAGTAPAARG